MMDPDDMHNFSYRISQKNFNINVSNSEMTQMSHTQMPATLHYCNMSLTFTAEIKISPHVPCT